ncbi:hypothetical protein [Neorhizobium galegae]|uniref:hypothetical protein n=1 Tax=Neorhizobium galegae TaxID=399 RepID=UPI0017844268|nr:hypothetical protein [Neorhizobium galegae]
MHNKASVSSFNIAFIGGGSFNWATKLMGDLAYDGTVTAEVRFCDLDQPAAGRDARIDHTERAGQAHRQPEVLAGLGRAA